MGKIPQTGVFDPSTKQMTLELDWQLVPQGRWARQRLLMELRSHGLTVHYQGGLLETPQIFITGKMSDFQLVDQQFDGYSRMEWAAENVLREHEEQTALARRRANPSAAIAWARAKETVRMRSWQEQVAPHGAPVEAAVEAVLYPDEPWHDTWHQEIDEAFRPVAVTLARKFMRPDEQVLAAFEDLIWTGGRGKPTKVGLVLFTYGLAVRLKGRSYRADYSVKWETITPIEPTYDPVQQACAVVRLGDLEARFTGGRALDAFRLQRALQNGTAKPSALASTNRTKSLPQQRVGTAPSQRLIRSARDAELVAAEWMQHWGFTHVQSTPVGADAGVDVTSEEAVAQVKAETTPVGRPKIQQHHGVATAAGKAAIFFALAGFTPQGQTFAEEVGMLLFTFDLQGQPEPVNPAAHGLVTRQQGRSRVNRPESPGALLFRQPSGKEPGS